MLARWNHLIKHPRPSPQGKLNGTGCSTCSRAKTLTTAPQMFGQIAEDTMRTEVLPREQEIYNKDWALTRKLLLKAAN